MERDVPMKEFGCFSHDPRDTLADFECFADRGGNKDAWGRGHLPPFWETYLFFKIVYVIPGVALAAFFILKML